MNGRGAWIVGGILVAALTAGVIYVAFVKPQLEQLPGRDAGLQGKNGKEKGKGKQAPAVYEPAPLALAQASTALYTGPNARQTGFKEGAFDAKRTAVLRGKVYDRDSKPLADVKVAVADHPEYGQSRSDAQGVFDFVVNGGGQLCIDYRKEGFLPLCRNIAVPWQDYAWLPDVVMTQHDATVTAVNLKADAPIQVVQGSAVKDQHGERRPTLLIPKGTVATMTLADGTKKELATLKVRATELTVGKTGPAAMPAPLPPNSAYTYAVDLSADEAVAVGAKDVRFNKPLFHYVENFLKFPPGTPVPTGYFDPAKRAWVPAENGIVVDVVAVNDGVADLVVGENRQLADANALTKLGITDAERRQLGSLYSKGASLWRVPIPHFSFWDCNWGFSPPGDAENPDCDAEGNGDDCTCDIPGASTIGVQQQYLGESVRLAGTPFRLHYQSDRSDGYKTGRSIRIKLSGPKTPKSLKRIELEVQVAGQRFTKEDFPGKADQSFVFVWDGKDGNGRPVAGGQWATVKVGWVYDGVYERNERFGSNGNGAQITGSITRQEVALWREFKTWIGAWDARSQGLGGWTLNVHHAYDVAGRILHFGDGRKQGGASRGMAPLNLGIVTIAGGGDADGLGNRGPAIKARLENPSRPGPAGTARDRYLSIPWPVIVAPAGDIYLADENNHVRHIDKDGIILTAAGGNVTKQQFRRISGLALAADGSLFIADFEANRIFRLATDGAVSVFAGTGKSGFSGDGGSATQAQLDGPTALAITADGSLYIADSFNHRIRRVGPDGIIATVAGNPEKNPGKSGPAWKGDYVGDGGPAANAKLYWPNALVLAQDGGLFISDSGNHVVRHISATGTITTFAGVKLSDSSEEFAGDGGPALKAKFNDLTALCLTPDGSLLIADTENHRIRRVGLDGIVTTIVGGEAKAKSGDFAGDGGPGSQAKLSYPAGIACAPDGSWLIYDCTRYIYGDGGGRSKGIRHRLRRVSPALPGFTNNEIAIPSQDGRALFKFDAAGRHLETRDAMTGALGLRFHYDTKARLSKIEDAFGNTCTIERDTNGHPQAIVAPYGQRTGLELNDGGYLAKIAPPGERPVEMAYNAGGLLKSFKDGRGAVSKFHFDDFGKLLKDESPAGGAFDLERRELPNGYEVSLATALKPPTNYRTLYLPGGGFEFINQCCCGAETTVRADPDGKVKTLFPDGTIKERIDQPDARWGMMGRNLHKTSLKTPGGRTAIAALEQMTTFVDKANPLSLKTQTTTLTLNGRKFTRTFDAEKRTLTQITPGGRESVTTLDEHGRVVHVQVAGLALVRLSYDAKGRLKEMVQGEGEEARRVTVDYDDAGRVAAITDPMKRTTMFAYDSASRLAKQILADKREIGFSFDARNNLLSLTPPGKSAHSFDYTAGGQLKLYEPPSAPAGSTKTVYEFNKDRQLTRILRPGDKQVTLDYDKVGHLETLHTPNGKWKLNFDSRTEQLNSVAGPEGSLYFKYDGFLMTGTKWEGEIQGALGVEFDDDFRIASRTVNGGSAVKLGYDSDGLLTSVGALQLKRDPKSGLVRSTKLGQVETTLEYNGFGERSHFSAKAGGQDILAVKYERDTLGRITTKTETQQGKVDTYGYDYDRAGRLTDVTKNSVNVGHYEYDSNGNRLRYEGQLGKFAGSYDSQDRVKSYGPISFTHTAAGEWLSKTEGGKTTTYTYDVLGNLRAVSLPDGTQVEYGVDAANRRISKKVNGKLVQGFLWQDLLKPAAELDGAGKVVSRFIYAGGANVPSCIEKAGKTYRIITDHIGSPRLVIDAASGEIAQRLEYDEFGNVLLDSNPGFQPFGFAGGLYDSRTKLLRFGARDYDAATGRWTARDPIGFGGRQANLYAYVGNSPVERRDPIGLSVGDIIVGGLEWWNDNVYGSIHAAEFAGSAGVGGATAIGYGSTFISGGAVVAGTGAEAAPFVFYPLGLGAGTEASLAAAGAWGAWIAGPVAAFGVGSGIGLGFNAGYEGISGQSLGEDWADMQFDPGGHGRSFGEWYRCLWPGASGCPPSGSGCCSGPARAGV